MTTNSRFFTEDCFKDLSRSVLLPATCFEYIIDFLKSFQGSALTNKIFFYCVFVIWIVISAYPLYQMFDNHGFLFYENAYDEAQYLQFDYSRAIQNISRPFQFLVTLGHSSNISGGWLNFIFDSIVIFLFPVVLRKIFIVLKFEKKTSNEFAVLLTLIPFWFGGSNPVENHLFYKSLSKGWIYWFSMPEANFLPIIRSPEPQLSILIFCSTLYFCLRRKIFYPLYLIAPFLYFFIGIPLLFIVFTLHVKKMIPDRLKYFWVPPVISYAMVAVGLSIAYRFVLNEDSKANLIESRLPFLSLNFCFCFLIFVFFYRRIPKPFRYFSFVVALSSLAAVNFQILTGWFAQPDNFEQFYGIYCPSILLLLIISTSKVLKRTGLFLSVVILAVFGIGVFKMNDELNRKIDLNENLLMMLKNDPANVAVNDVKISSRLGMLFPRQKFTFFAWAQVLPRMASRQGFEKYICEKKNILKDTIFAAGYEKVFSDLDKGYRYGTSDFILAHCGRKKDFDLKYDAGNRNPAAPCEPLQLHYFWIR